MSESVAPAGPPGSRALALRIAERLYGVVPALRWVRSDEVDAFVASFGSVGGAAGGGPDKVIKVDRPGKGVVAQESRLLPYFRDAGVDVATIEHAGVDQLGGPGGADAVAWNAQPFLELRGMGTIYADDVGAAREIAERLGRSVARLHALSRAEVPGGADAAANRYWVPRWWRGEQERHASFLGERSVYRRLCEWAMTLFDRLPTHFGNGQWYQCRYDGRGTFAIIDWGTCGTTWPMYDLAMALAGARSWCRWATLPEGCGVSRTGMEDDLVPRVIASHLSGRELSAAEWDELWFWRAYHALHSAAGHRAKGEVEREREQLEFVHRMLDERPGALG